MGASRLGEPNRSKEPFRLEYRSCPPPRAGHVRPSPGVSVDCTSYGDTRFYFAWKLGLLPLQTSKKVASIASATAVQVQHRGRRALRLQAWLAVGFQKHSVGLRNTGSMARTGWRGLHSRATGPWVVVCRLGRTHDATATGNLVAVRNIPCSLEPAAGLIRGQERGRADGLKRTPRTL